MLYIVESDTKNAIHCIFLNINNIESTHTPGLWVSTDKKKSENT